MSRRNISQAGAVAFMAAGLTVSIMGSPAQAQTPPPSCPGITTGDVIFGDGYTCQLGDKIYSNFVITQDTDGKLLASNFSFGNPDPSHNLSVQNGNAYLAGTYSFTYQMAATPGPFVFNAIKTAATGALQNPGVTDTWTKTLSSTPVTIPNSVISTQVSPGGSSGLAFYVGTVTAATFNSVLSVTDGGLTQFSDTLTQRDTTPVPGPLPILGAGTAFALSRKLRRRISVAS